VNGNIKIAGGSSYTGALAAGGPGAQVQVNGNYVQNFPKGMASSVQFPKAVSLTGFVEL
jgi:hypothetical protein